MRLLRISVLVWSLAGVARADDIDARIADAIAAHQAGDYATARDRLRAIADEHPTPRVLRALAMCDVELGEMTSAYRALSEALSATGEGPGALDAAQRAHANELFAHVTGQIARLARDDDGFLLDGAPLDPAADGWTPVHAGPHTIAVVSDGVTVHARVTLAAGESTSLAALLDVDRLPRVAPPAPSPVAPPAPTPHVDPPPTPPQRERFTSFVATAGGMIGGHDGGTGWYAAAGPLFTLGALTRFTDDLSVGGTISIAWSRLLDDGNPSETHTWASVGLRLAIELRPSASPFALFGSLGVQLGSRAHPTDVGGIQHFDGALELELGPRLYIDGDLLFVGADLRVIAGGLVGADAVLLLGIRTL